MTESTENIILIGYRATGKSSVGRLLAEKMARPFIDVDQRLEQQAGGSIADMVAEQGWDFFRARERQALLELTGRPGQVLACGGGAILHQDIWPAIKKSNFVVWLKADIQTICRRLAGDTATERQRPSLSGQDIYAEAADILRERTPLYAAGCHLELDATGDLEDIVDSIMHHFHQIRQRAMHT